MKDKKLLNFWGNLLESIIIGAVIGAVVGIYQLAMQYAVKGSHYMYSSKNPWIIIGMILAGVVIGKYGFNILERDSSFELFGKVGIYYIMFLAGLEMDLENLKKNLGRAFVFGLLTFAIPFAVGMWVGMSLFRFSVGASLLLSSIFASHTLVAYPIVGRYGLSRHASVSISIGGTMFGRYFGDIQG